MRFQRRAALAAAVAAALFAQGNVHAAGFALIEHSAQGMGNAFAGGGAAAGDASTIWFNPASMTALPDGAMVQASGHVISPSFEFTNNGSVQAPLANFAASALLPGSRTSDDGATVAVVPNLYYKRDFGQDLKFGLSLNVPFGLATEYKSNWIGRYQAVESEIRTFNLNPSIAYRVNDQLSLGAGFSVMYIDATLSNAIDFNAVCVGSSLAGGLSAAAATATCGAIGAPGSGTSDGFVTNEADDFGFGFNLGMMITPAAGTRLSVAYRSEVKQSLDGTARFRLPTTAISPVGAVDAGIRAAFANDGITADVDLPASLSFSAYHEVNDQWAVMGDATWTGWSSIPELRIKFDRPTTAGGPGVERLSWDDTWRLSLGAAYKPDRQWTLRGGVAYDQAPVSDPTLRTARLPENDRVWLSLGAGYQYNDNLSVDVGYSHLFIDDTQIRRTGSTGNVLIGTYESDVNIFSAQVRYRW